MQQLAAKDLVAWLEQEVARRLGGASLSLGGPVPDGERHIIPCTIELPCYWLVDDTSTVFSLELEVVAQAEEGVTLVAAHYAWREGHGDERSVRIRLDQPLLLECVHIAKPWGQEIWFTGVEERGVCGVRGDGGVVPLPWLLEPLSSLLTGGRRELVLLKILDPLPEAVWGDLYFELHEEKQEVYVVTNVDRSAWPDGVGAIRFGFDTARLQSYDDEDAFRQDFRASVADYEAVRREIDAALDEQRRRQGIALNAALEPSQLELWQQSLPEDLMARERELRAAMEAFSQFKPLCVGDVVKVPCFTPHSLQHGVRTVEFQTPVYERKILSFAQKVLTQAHWDTDSGVALMQLQAPEEESFTVVRESDAVLVERIVDFDDFEVQRWRLQPMCSDRLDVADAYALVMAVDGPLRVGEVSLSAEQACLAVAGLRGGVMVKNEGTSVVTVLVALPAGGADSAD